MKIHEKEEDVVVACCDEKLLGKEIKEDEAFLSIRKSFYGEETCSKGKLVAAMKDASIINLIGENSVSIGVDEGFINEENILFIGDVPHAQMIKYSGPE